MSAVVPEPPPPSAPSGGASFDFLKPLTFVFDDPRWVQKVLIGGLFVIASFFIIGVFFLLGYLAQLARNVIRGDQHPLPEWDDLGKFFGEGAKLLVVGLIYVIPVIVVGGVVIIPMAIMGNSSDNETVRSMAGMSVTCVWCLIFPLGLAVSLWLPGAFLMVIVTGDFKAGFEFGRIFRFIRANIGNYLLSFVLALIAGLAAQLGVLLLCVGVVFTAFWARTVTTYAFAQTYRLATVR
jgi:Protein of unknown function (DUF4013)